MLQRLDAPQTPAWLLELIVVARARSTSTERAVIARDASRDLLVRVGHGVYVERAAFEALSPEGRHTVRMRALAATWTGPLVFSHWSAAVLHGLPVLRSRLDRVHVTVEDDDDRHRTGVAHHFFLLGDDPGVRIGGLAATGLGRTVVDVAGGAPFEEGVMIADAALRRGVARAALTEAVALAGRRRASRRIREVVAFAHPGGESPAESLMRVTACRLGVEVPRLQHPVRLADGDVFLDAYFPLADAALEVDGDTKYRDPRMAPQGAAAVVLAEKRREDQVRARVHAFARAGWTQAGSVALLGPVLAGIGVRPTRPRTAFEAYCAAASIARPRLPLR